ncbi:hypothetical protein CEXT_318351 [Caerostris extrusa]|uniref:Uncharacterized protein n=1 Tax=Caerostris extrusa TaxID=172846 RepID=A0AAV4N0Q0_CAEEX|nr:hypothetical protein CEXT_318351 [Caerostris extrusa]
MGGEGEKKGKRRPQTGFVIGTDGFDVKNLFPSVFKPVEKEISSLSSDVLFHPSHILASLIAGRKQTPFSTLLAGSNCFLHRISCTRLPAGQGCVSPWGLRSERDAPSFLRARRHKFAIKLRRGIDAVDKACRARPVPL